jgi:hypothetical protein
MVRLRTSTATLLLLALSISGCAVRPAPSGVTDRLSIDPHQPDGALNLFCESIQEGDIVTARRQIDPGSVDIDHGKLRADALIADAQFFCVAEDHYGIDAAIRICEAYFLPVGVPVRKFSADEFRYSNDGMMANGWRNVDARDPEDTARIALAVLRGPDGIWRIWSPAELRFPSQITIEFVKEDIRMKGRLAEEINTGRYPNPEDLIQAVPPIRPRPAQWQFNPPPQPQITRTFDKSTPQGAIGAYYLAFVRHDRSGIAEFFYCDGDPSDELANARAARIISVLTLKKTVEQTFHIGENDDGVLLAEGLTGKGDQPWWGSPDNERDDRATIVFEDNSELPMRKVGGVWKLDVTPPNPQTPTTLARILEHDSSVLDQITSGVDAGIYRTAREVYESLLSAKLEHDP